MIDTIEIGTRAEVTGASPRCAVVDGWWRHFDEGSWRGVLRQRQRALKVCGPVTVCWMPSIKWASVSVSVPRAALGDNAVLASWSHVKQVLAASREIACEELGVRLPPLGEAWSMSRIDPVWSWAVDTAPYLSALRVARLPRTEVQSFATDVRWMTRKGHVRGRCYDKAVETGREVELPLRLERQVRAPRRYVVRTDDGRRIWNALPLWTPEVVCSVMVATMRALGLDRPIPSTQGARAVLREHLGARRGETVWRAMLAARECGSWALAVPNRATCWRFERDARAAGVTGLSDVELPPLPLPHLLR